MCLLQIHFELQPVPGFAMIERALASANYGMRTGLEIEISLGAHRLDDIYNCRKASGRSIAAGKLRQFYVLRSDTKKHGFAEEFLCAGPLWHG